MKIELYLPYFPEGDVAGTGNDISDEEYANKLMETYGGGYNSFMNQAMSNYMDERYGVSQVLPEKYAIGSVEDNGKVEYYKFDCILNDENDRNMSNDEFMFYVNSNDMCAFFVNMIITDEPKDGDAVNELNFWLKESRRIMYDQNIADDYKVAMLPFKDLLIKIPGNIPNTFRLVGARVVDQDNANSFAIIVTKIERE